MRCCIAVGLGRNMRSWGVHGLNCSNLSVSSVRLLSVAGMGFRCDFCSDTYVLERSEVALKPGTLRPMSITADAGEPRPPP